jgi:hypothetical protein
MIFEQGMSISLGFYEQNTNRMDRLNDPSV